MHAAESPASGAAASASRGCRRPTAGAGAAAGRAVTVGSAEPAQVIRASPRQQSQPTSAEPAHVS